MFYFFNLVLCTRFGAVFLKLELKPCVVKNSKEHLKNIIKLLFLLC